MAELQQLSPKTQQAVENVANILEKQSNSKKAILTGIEYIDVKPIHDADAQNFEPSEEEINLTNLRINKMISFADCPSVTKMVLRQNVIPAIERLECGATLQELDLYENQIEFIQNLSHLSNLVWLDLSFNLIRVIENLDGPMALSLHELYLINNKITHMGGLSELKELRLLELGSNRLRVIEGLDGIEKLEQLWLGRNKITQISGLEKLVKLHRMSLQSNRLTELGTGLRFCVMLQELYLSHNGLVSMAGIECLVNLRIIDMGSNQIRKLESLENLTELTELWINHNLLENWEELIQLHNKPHMATLYLEGNPMHSDPLYKSKILAHIPTLTQLDWEELNKKPTVVASAATIATVKS